MNPVDQSQLNALLATYGHVPFGMSGYGPAFGELPGTAYMPPGGQYGGGTFFGPQIPNPHHLNFGPGLFGSAAGYGMEQIAGGMGMQYTPRGVNYMDIMQGRSFERGLTQAGDFGRGLDEQKLAKAIEMGFRAAGQSSPQATAHANALAATVSPSMSAMGFMQHMPGGSAETFAQQMFMASQNMRDFTRSEYSLGAPTADSLSMISRLSDFFMPVPGVVDPIQTRGMKLGDIGRMAGTLTSYGLIDTNVSTDDMRAAAKELEYNFDDLTGGEKGRLKDLTRANNVGKQLQSYAELFGTLRELTGDPEAPIPQLVTAMQQLTGGKFQQMQPGQMQQMLIKVKETARASNIAMDTMMETLIAASQQNMAMGGSGLGGAQMALTSRAAAVAMQTVTPGAFSGRMSPEKLGNLENALAQRGRVSINTQINAQAAMLTDELLSGGGLTEAQKTELAGIREQAMAGGFTLPGQNELIQRFASLGVDPNRARLALQSDVGVQRWLDRNPDFDQAIRAGQQRDIQKDVVGYVRGRYANAMGKGSNDRLIQQLDRTAAASNMSNDQLLNVLGEAFFHAPTGSVDEISEYLKQQNVNASGLNLQEFYGDVERSGGMQRRYRGLGISSREELGQQYSVQAQEAKQAHEKRIRAATAGQMLLSDIGAANRGGALDRIVGAVAEGATSLKEVSMAAFGFEPTEDIQKALGENWVKEMSSLHAELSEIKDDPSKAGRVEEIHKRMSELTDAASEFAPGGAFAGVDRTKGTKKMLDIMGEDVRAAAKTMQDTTASESERLQATQIVADALGEMEDSGAYDEVLGELAGSRKEAFDFQTNMLSMEGSTLQSQLAQLKDENLSKEDRERITSHVLGDISRNVGAGMSSLYGGTRRLHQNLKRRTKGERTSLQDKVQLLQEFSETSKRFVDATGDERQMLAGQLEEISYDAFASGMFTVDPDTGEAVPNDSFIRTVMLVNKDTHGKSDEAVALAEKFRGGLHGMFDAQQFLRIVGETGTMDDDTLNDLQKQLKDTGTLDFSDFSVPGAGKRLSVLKRMDMAAKGQNVRGKAATEEVRTWRQLGRIKEALSKRSPTGELAGEQAKMVGRYISALGKNKQLFGSDGLLTDSARDLIYAQYTNPNTGDMDIEAASNLVTALEDMGSMVGMDEEQRRKYLKEHFGKSGAKDGKDDTAAEGEESGGTSFQLVDGDTGEPIKTIEIRRVDDGTLNGRAAAGTQSRKQGPDYDVQRR